MIYLYSKLDDVKRQRVVFSSTCLRSTEGSSLVGGSGGILHQKIFKFGRYFQHLPGICLRKIDLKYENVKQLQVSIIKITESKENNSVHRLNRSGLTGPGKSAAPLAPRQLRLCNKADRIKEF